MQIEAIGREFDCRIKSYKPLRAVYIAETNKGLMIVKETSREPDKILYIHGLKEYLHERGFETLDRYLLSKNGLPFIIQDNRIFVMEKFIEGRECSFTNPFDRQNAVKALARLHNRGKGYVPHIGCATRNNLGKWKRIYLKKIDYLIYLKCEVRKKRHKDFFDKLFLEDVDFMIHMAWKSYDTLAHANYEIVSTKAEAEKAICHHDYTYHNIIIDSKNIVNVIDFDYSCHELPIYDLASYVFKIMKRYSFDIDIAFKTIEDYSNISSLTRDDMMLMLSIFEFPQRFWRVAERYYEKKTNWSDEKFKHKYEEILDIKSYIQKFTENFRYFM